MSNVKIDEQLFLDMSKYLLQHDDDSDFYRSIIERISLKFDAINRRLEYAEHLKKDTD